MIIQLITSVSVSMYIPAIWRLMLCGSLRQSYVLKVSVGIGAYSALSYWML